MLALAQGGLDCAPCHARIVKTFQETAHARASRTADAGSILGSFEAGRSQLFTRQPGVYFRMEQRADGFYQTGVQGGRARSERFDLVIGSGRRGQSFLYWRNGLLFQLPVSYHAGTDRWINSPGYPDGAVHFDRGIPPQCLGCHASGFHLAKTPGGLRYTEGYSLGIGCATCHGQAQRHEQIVRPNGSKVCTQCHAGLEEEKPPEPDVHGDQVGLLRSSRCFQKSNGMTCATCHDVHQTQRDLVVMAARCQSCHSAAHASRVPAAGNCVECHMPLLPSKLIEVQSYRTHKIGIYSKK